MTNTSVISYHTLIKVTSNNYSTYTIHEDTKMIVDRAFYSCERMTNIVIPDRVTSIGEDAFYHCRSLTSVVIGDSVTSIGEDAFYNTAYYNNAENWENDVLYIGKYLIEAKTSISGTYTIKKETTVIADYAFYDCGSLTSVVIGDSVTSIGSSAFDSCYNLTTVYYKGTASEWSAISIGSYNSDLTNETRYYYSENEPALNADGTAYNGNYWHYDTDGVTPVVWVYTTEE